MSLLDLHAAIQVAMGWKQAHLYEFVVGSPGQNQYFFGVPDEQSDAELGRVTIRSGEVKLMDVFHEIGENIRYLYDMGDNWEHEIELRGIVREDTITKYPHCPSGYGACPPEDVGGIPGFRELLQAIKEKNKAMLKEYDAWLGKRFDPEAFQPQHSYFFHEEWKWARKKENF